MMTFSPAAIRPGTTQSISCSAISNASLRPFSCRRSPRFVCCAWSGACPRRIPMRRSCERPGWSRAFRRGMISDREAAGASRRPRSPWGCLPLAGCVRCRPPHADASRPPVRAGSRVRLHARCACPKERLSSDLEPGAEGGCWRVACDPSAMKDGAAEIASNVPSTISYCTPERCREGGTSTYAPSERTSTPPTFRGTLRPSGTAYHRCTPRTTLPSTSCAPEAIVSVGGKSPSLATRFASSSFHGSKSRTVYAGPGTAARSTDSMPTNRGSSPRRLSHL